MESAVGVSDEDDSDNEDTDGISVQIDKMENKCAMLNDDRNIWIQLNEVNNKLHQDDLTRKKQRKLDKWKVKLKEIEVELQLVDKERKYLIEQLDDNFNEQNSVWNLYKESSRNPMNSSYYKVWNVLKDINAEISIKKNHLREEYTTLNRTWMEIKKLMLKEQYGFEVAVSRYEYTQYESVEVFPVEKVNTVFVQHQPEFNTVQELEENCQQFI